MGILVILIAPVPNFQTLFTELKKLVPLSRYRATNFWKMPKSCTFWGFSNFQSTISHNSLFSATNQFLDPIFGQVVAFYGLFKRYLGISEILRFLAIFSPIKTQKMVKIAFCTSGPQKWPKISQSQSDIWYFRKHVTLEGSTQNW